MDKKELVQDVMDIIETNTVEDIVDTLRGYRHIVDDRVLVSIKIKFDNYIDNIMKKIDKELKK